MNESFIFRKNLDPTDGGFINPPPVRKPDPTEIRDAIVAIEQKLAIKQINQARNFAVKEGYAEALRILKSGQMDHSGIDKLKTVQGRAIAVLAVDFLKGECDFEVLVNVPVRGAL